MNPLVVVTRIKQVANLSYRFENRRRRTFIQLPIAWTRCERFVPCGIHRTSNNTCCGNTRWLRKFKFWWKPCMRNGLTGWAIFSSRRNRGAPGDGRLRRPSAERDHLHGMSWGSGAGTIRLPWANWLFNCLPNGIVYHTWRHRKVSRIWFKQWAIALLQIWWMRNLPFRRHRKNRESWYEPSKSSIVSFGN